MCVSDAVNASNISTGFQIYEKRDESDDYELHGQFTNIRLFKFHPFKFFKLQNVTAFSNSFVLDGVTWWTEEENHWIYLLQVLAQVGR